MTAKKLEATMVPGFARRLSFRREMPSKLTYPIAEVEFPWEVAVLAEASSRYRS